MQREKKQSKRTSHQTIFAPVESRKGVNIGREENKKGKLRTGGGSEETETCRGGRRECQ
jgi:hypothetical protein